MNEIQEEISSFEPGVFEPTRRTLVRFEFEEPSCCPPGLEDTYSVVWPGPCGFTGYYDFITVTKIADCVWEGTGINPDTGNPFTIRLSLDTPILEGCPDDSCGQWRVDFEPRVAYKCYNDGDPIGNYTDTGTGICGGVIVTIA